MVFGGCSVQAMGASMTVAELMLRLSVMPPTYNVLLNGGGVGGYSVPVAIYIEPNGTSIRISSDPDDEPVDGKNYSPRKVNEMSVGEVGEEE